MDEVQSQGGSECQLEPLVPGIRGGDDETQDRRAEIQLHHGVDPSCGNRRALRVANREYVDTFNYGNTRLPHNRQPVATVQQPDHPRSTDARE